MNLTNIVESDSKLRAVFTWNTKIGIAPAFGSRPISWYQQDQFEAIGSVERAARKANISLMDIRCTKGFLTGVSIDHGKRVKFARIALGKVETL